MEIHIHSLDDLDVIARKMGYVHRDEMDKLVGERIAALLNRRAVGDVVGSGLPRTFAAEDEANAPTMADRDVEDRHEMAIIAAHVGRESIVSLPVDVQSAAAGNPFAVGEQAAPATRRKRRTKAEMEADAAPDAPDDTAQPAVYEPVPDGEPADAAAPQGDAKAWIAKLAGEIGTMDLAECLGKAREFIALRSTAVYREAFPLTGLDEQGVISYSPEQCALLAAALDYLAQRPA